jgi:protein-L-isoaspartate(D-aspartate) O-methyltransferase
MDIAHFNMVEQQIRPWNVHDSRLLKRIAELDRCHFVPEDQRALCWVDTMIHLEDGSRMLEPKMVARMIQAMEIRPQDKVLVVGAGSGYAAALCSGLANSVECVDTQQTALDRAVKN